MAYLYVSKKKVLQSLNLFKTIETSNFDMPNSSVIFTLFISALCILMMQIFCSMENYGNFIFYLKYQHEDKTNEDSINKRN
jgi:hypothetical protein